MVKVFKWASAVNCFNIYPSTMANKIVVVGVHLGFDHGGTFLCKYLMMITPSYLNL